MVASFPAEGPAWIRATRPTSTILHDDALISASPIVVDSELRGLAGQLGLAMEVSRRTGRCFEGFVVVDAEI